MPSLSPEARAESRGCRADPGLSVRFLLLLRGRPADSRGATPSRPAPRFSEEEITAKGARRRLSLADPVLSRDICRDIFQERRRRGQGGFHDEWQNPSPKGQQSR